MRSCLGYYGHYPELNPLFFHWHHSLLLSSLPRYVSCKHQNSSWLLCLQCISRFRFYTCILKAWTITVGLLFPKALPLTSLSHHSSPQYLDFCPSGWRSTYSFSLFRLPVGSSICWFSILYQLGSRADTRLIFCLTPDLLFTEPHLLLWNAHFRSQFNTVIMYEVWLCPFISLFWSGSAKGHVADRQLFLSTYFVVISPSFGRCFSADSVLVLTLRSLFRQLLFF